MNNRTIKLLAVALFVPTLAQARQISGLVLSENDSTAIVGAVCELKSDAATAIKAAGDVNGAFTINTSDRKAATLSVSAVGYGQAEIVIPDGGHDIKDLKIYLPDIKTLEAVTVTAAAATMRNGRTIVYPSAQKSIGIGILRRVVPKTSSAGPYSRPYQPLAERRRRVAHDTH